jgi:protein-S-isoprenylcysteine O-methyltransferase Ste14
MKAGLFLILIGESVSLHSTALACWAAIFMLANVVYIRLSEEPGLRARFGSHYSDYCASVPRWWPRLSRRQDSAYRGTRP